MPILIPATIPVTPAKKPAKRVTRAVALSAHLQPAAEDAAETEAASDTTDAENSTKARVDAQGGEQIAEVKNAVSNNQASASKNLAAGKPAAKKLPAARTPAAKKAPANKRVTALKASEASSQAESTEDEGPSEEPEALGKSALKRMSGVRGERAARKPSSGAMDIDSAEEAEGSQQNQTQKPKQQRQPPASNRQGNRAGSTNPRGGGNKKLGFLYPDEFPSTVPLSKTRFRGDKEPLPVVRYTEAGEREPFYIHESKQLREELLMEIPYVFHQEREHRLANEALELTREYVTALMYQEMNRNSLIRQHMADDDIHKENGVEFSAEEKKKRSDLLEDLQHPRRLQKINYLHSKMKEMERGLEYFATEAEEKARVDRLLTEKKEAEANKKRKVRKAKGKVAKTAEVDEEETSEDDERTDEEKSEADDEDE